MPKKASSIKNRIWERDRRNRFKASFEKLASLLPPNTSKTPLSKVLVVQKATELIQELQNKQNCDETNHILKLRKENDFLNNKCSILTKIIEEAGLQVPSDCNVDSLNKSLTQNEKNDETDKTKRLSDNFEVEKGKDTTVEISKPDNIVKNKNTAKPVNKKVAGPTKKILEASKTQLPPNASIQNPCPIVIIVNDTQLNPQPTINNFKTANNLTIVKNTMMPSLKMVASPLKLFNGIKTSHNNGMQKIASKGSLKADFNNAFFMNKVPIPPLNKSTSKVIKKKVVSKIKPKKIKRVTYRMLRQSKILKRKIVKKKLDDNIKTDKNSKDEIEANKSTDKTENIEINNKENKNSSNDIIERENDKSNKIVATYSIDSICKTNDLIPSIPKPNNILPMQISESKKDSRSPCIDNNSKCDPLSDLSNDLFASLQVAPMGNHQTGCTSPTAAFLLAFPLVSSLNGGKVNQVGLDENIETPEPANSLLQLGNQKSLSESVPGTNLLNLDQFSTLFTSKDQYKNQQVLKTNKDVKMKEKPLENHSIKANSQCLYTYNNNCVQNDVYNSCFESGNKNEKNKFSHTNIINDNSFLKSNVTSSSSQNLYGGDMNYTQAKTLSTNLTYSTAITQNEATSLAPSYNTPNLYNAYNPFYNNVNKEKSTYIPPTSLLSSFNNSQNLNDSNKLDNYQEQGKDVSMRYKPYATSNNSKIKVKDLKDQTQSTKPPVNWMTTPDIRPNSCSLPKSHIQNSNNYNYSNIDFNIPGTNDHLSSKEPFFIVPPNNTNENMWNNSIKMQDSQLNLPTTLPTLIGDLALGTNTTFHQAQNNHAKQFTSCYKDRKDAAKEQMDKNSKINDAQSNSWSGSFSVSQLVDQYKSEKDLRHYPCSKQKYLPLESKKNTKYEDDISIMMDSVNNESDIFSKPNEQSGSQSNAMTKGIKKYSTEALLSDDTKHDVNLGSFKQQQFFPFVDFSTDLHQPMTKFNKQHVKTADSSYPYPTTNNYPYSKNSINNSNIEINSLSNKLLHLSGQNEVQTQFMQQHNLYKNSDNLPIKNMQNPNNTFAKKSSKKNKLQENNMIDFNYLPGNHSPVLPDDSFYNYSIGYTSNTSTQNYQNQNLLYSGNVRSHLNQHHTLPTFSSQLNANSSISKSVNNAHIPAPSPSITNNSSSLTNFNLSAIFPEINEKIRPGW